AIRALGRSVLQHTCALYAGKASLRLDGILSDDGLCVPRTIASDVIDSLIEAIDHFHRNNGVEKFLRPIVLARRSDARVGALGLRVAPHLAARLDQHLNKRAK